MQFFDPFREFVSRSVRGTEFDTPLSPSPSSPRCQNTDLIGPVMNAPAANCSDTTARAISRAASSVGVVVVTDHTLGIAIAPA